MVDVKLGTGQTINVSVTLGSGGVSSVDTFLELSDTPNSYSGLANKIAKVNTEETGLNLVDNIMVTVSRDDSGDYICDGTDDNIQIQEAIDYINSLGGGLVYIKKGTYNISTQITVYSNVKIVGEEKVSTILLKSNNNVFSMFSNSDSVSGNNNITMQDFTIDGNTSTYPVGNHGIAFTTVSDCKFIDLDIKNCLNTQLIIIDATTGFNENNKIVRCNVDNGNNGILMAKSRYSDILNSCATNITGSPGYGIQLKNDNYECKVINSFADTCVGGIVFAHDSAETVSCTRSDMINCISINCTNNIIINDANFCRELDCRSFNATSHGHFLQGINDCLIRAEDNSSGAVGFNVLTGTNQDALRNIFNIRSVNQTTQGIRFRTSCADNIVESSYFVNNGDIDFADDTGGNNFLDSRFTSDDKTNLDSNTTHRTSTGEDHSFIDQDVTDSSTPQFRNLNLRLSGGGSGDSATTNYQDRATMGYDGTTGNALVQGGSGKGIKLNVNNTITAMDLLSGGFINTYNKFTIDQDTDELSLVIDSEATNNPLIDLRPLNSNTRGDISFSVERTADPTTPNEGDMWYNSTDNKFRGYDGSSVTDFGGSGGSSTNLSITVSVDGEDNKGDYVCDGTSDQVQFNSAIDEATVSGGTVYIKDGSYVLTSAIIPKSNVTVICSDNVVITRATNFDMIRSTDVVNNFKWKGGQIGNDSFVNENFNIANLSNTNLVFEDIKFLSNAGRAIFAGGNNIRVVNCDCVDVAQFFGTPRYDASSVVPFIYISQCNGENVSFTGSENEFIEVNCHSDSNIIVSDCTCKGYLENSFEMNAKNFLVVNCKAIADPSVPGSSHFTCSIDNEPKETQGAFINCTVESLGASQNGFYFDVCDGVQAIGCRVYGDNETTLAGTAFRADGGASTGLQLIGCSAKDVDIAISNDIEESLSVIGFDYINVTTKLVLTTGSSIGMLLDKSNQYRETTYLNPTSGSSPTIDFSNGNVQRIRMGSSTVTPTWVNPLGSGEITLLVQQDGGGSRTLVFSSDFNLAGGIAPTWTSTPNAYDIIKFWYDGTSYWEISRSLDLK